MQIKSADDLFSIYEFDEELQLKIKQYLNANPNLLPQINALCLGAKVLKTRTQICPNVYLFKMKKMSAVYKIEKDFIKFIEIHIS
ncbi:hypothetical protein [Campylobacter helveticus]|uniref:hypothetical protein n=1 Tax=Campylobacter helveticus TaxID=28898 RepID=UPI0010540F47|nr:hypothetical protein [Campylobacter helveticus]QBL11270.1 hypothetical protein A0073_01605 [Campylobacter helveticus]